MVSKCVFQNHPFCEGPRNKVEHITKEKVAAFTYPPCLQRLQRIRTPDIKPPSFHTG